MLLAIFAVIVGLALLVWSADAFVDGAAAVAKNLGMPALLIGMVIVGFGTSAPELVVSGLASYQGNPGIALGNAYGSNIANIGLILGLTALLSPIAVKSSILRNELPILFGTCLLTIWMLSNNEVARWQSIIFLSVFALVMAWSIYKGMTTQDDSFADEVEKEMEEPMGFKLAMMWLVVGLVILVLSSRLMVWGAVFIATELGVSDIVIGLTIVAVGTSLPELASSLAAVRKNVHDLVIGNVLGSNLFNTLAVVGIAGTISPLTVGPELLSRDVAVMTAMTFVLFIFGYGFRGAGTGRINRVEGFLLLATYIGYTAVLVSTAIPIGH